jgi:hypothetical protein
LTRCSKILEPLFAPKTNAKSQQKWTTGIKP